MSQTAEQNVMWDNNYIQFARLISEIDTVGGFTVKVLKDLSDEMDLDINYVGEIIDRAKNEFDKNKGVYDK